MISKLAKNIIEKYVVKPWPAGGYTFPMSKDPEEHGCEYICGVGNLSGRCWVETKEEAISIILEYPDDVEIKLSLKEFIGILAFEQS
jgi:hypothetical protein